MVCGSYLKCCAAMGTCADVREDRSGEVRLLFTEQNVESEYITIIT